MGVGMQVFGDNGTIQFDTESPAYAFVGKGQIAMGTNSPSDFNNWSLGGVDNLPSFDTYALSCRSGAVIPGMIGFQDYNSLYVSATADATVVNYYLFRAFSKFPSIGGAGLECLTASGQLAYSTAYRPLSIIAKHPVTNMYQNMQEGRGLPGGREYAFLGYGNMNRDMGNGGGGSGGLDVPSFEFNGANAAARLVDGGYNVEEVRGNGLAWFNNINGGFLIADVTGL